MLLLLRNTCYRGDKLESGQLLSVVGDVLAMMSDFLCHYQQDKSQMLSL